MATLAAQLETDIQVLVDSQTLTWLTNKNNPAASSALAALLTKACAHAAADLQAILGTSPDGDDTEAVSIGTSMALHKLRYEYRGMSPSEGEITYRSLEVRAERLRDARRQEETTTFRWHAPDSTQGDKRYPSAARDRGYKRSTDYKG